MFKLKKLLFISLGLFGFFANAQNEYSKWYFGNHAALDFMTNPPTILNNNAMYAAGGSSSIADTAGNLLFYTNGVTIWNKQHATMANGTSIAGNNSGVLSAPALIVKHPNNSNLYYVFVMGGGPNYYNSNVNLIYSIVDMSLAAGMGSVTVKNATVYNSFTTGQLAATKHANGIDYWIMMHERNTNNFRAYLLTSAGVNTTAIVSSIGPTYTGFAFGCFNFSHAGQKLAAALGGYSIPTIVELYDFDNSTGIVSNSLTLDSQGAYACEFSPDDTKLYSGGWGAVIKQWDLSAGSDTAILASATIIDTNSTVYGNTYSFAGMQLAPNGKIYVAIMGSQSLGVINNPNALGLNCNWVYNGQPISAIVNGTLSYSESGLPNMIKTLNTTTTSCVTQIMSNPQSICAGSFYTINGHTYTVTGSYNDVFQSVSGCDSIIVTQLTVKPSYTVNNQQSICAGSSYIFNNHTYTVTGTYNDTLQTVLGCDSIIVTQLTVNNLPVINFVVFPFYSNSYLCQGELTTFHAVGANTYTWVVNGANAAVGNSMTIVPISTFSLFVTGESADGCVGSSQVVQFYVETDCFLSIKENLSNKINLSVYPNPASEILNVDISTSFNATENLSISIIDIYGREIIKNEKLEIKNGGAEINVKNLSKGIYVLRVSNQNREVLYQQKLVKE